MRVISLTPALLQLPPLSLSLLLELCSVRNSSLRDVYLHRGIHTKVH